jgi:hypothetical protein
MADYKDVNKPNKKSRFKQGYYKPENVEKYTGDPTKIIYRSSWEYKFCRYCDATPQILNWSSEPFPIRYFDIVKQKERSYFVDFYIKVETVDGKIKEYLVEVKPESKLKPPVFPPNLKQTLKRLKQFNDLQLEFINNKTKKDAAEAYAASMGYKYMIVTEEFLDKQNIQ